MSKRISRWMIAFSSGIVAVVLAVPGCQASAPELEVDMTLDTAAEQREVAQVEEPAPTVEGEVIVAEARKDGTRLWEQNCARCHNLRQPLEHSDREWDIIVHHMRVRANLTADEHRLIASFLRSAN